MKIISHSIRSGDVGVPAFGTKSKSTSTQRRSRAAFKMNCPILIVISLGWLLHAHTGSGGGVAEAAISNRASTSSRSMSNVAQSASSASSSLTAPQPRFMSRGHTYRAVVGDTLVLPCQVENLGNFVLLWRRGTNVLTASNIMVTRDERVRLIDGYNLEISDLEPQDAGDYVCQISDKINRDQVHTVEILVPPSVRAIPTSGQLQARKGGPITLECKGSGNPVPSIYWTKKRSEQVHGPHRRRTDSDPGEAGTTTGGRLSVYCRQWSGRSCDSRHASGCAVSPGYTSGKVLDTLGRRIRGEARLHCLR
nr:hemicentin-1 isoform X2 [Drosophila bipectinata]